MSEPVYVESPEKNISIGRKPGDTNITLMIHAPIGPVHVEMTHRNAGQLVAGLVAAMSDGADDLGKQLTEWIGVG